MALSFMAGVPALKDLNADLKRRMDQAVSTFQSSLASTRAGRASVHMLDSIKIDYYGALTPVSQLAQLSAPEPQMILISPYDPTILKEIEKAIRAAEAAGKLKGKPSLQARMVLTIPEAGLNHEVEGTIELE